MPDSTTIVARVRCRDLRPGESVRSSYHLSLLERRSKKNGEPYFSLTLSDATGSVQAMMWDNHDGLVAGTIQSEDFVLVEGSAADYKGNLQLTIRRIERLTDQQVELADFVPTSPRSRPEMEAELDALIARVQQPDCRRLLDRFFGHAKFRELFCAAPAAVRIHQAYVGGLLEHTLNVMKNALGIAAQYEQVDYDTLITGGLLHDIGKIREFDWRRTITYSDEGRLVGHITIGAQMADSAIRILQRDPNAGFPESLRLAILHLILSHHGKLEFGSPTVPKTREALILHYADYADAYLTSFSSAVAEAQARGESWTPYNKMFESYLFAGGAQDRAANGLAPPAGQEAEEQPEQS